MPENISPHRVYQHRTKQYLVLTLGQAKYSDNRNMLLVIYQDLETKEVLVMPYGSFVRDFVFIN